MALPPSALSEILKAFRAGEGLDLIRDSVRLTLQELIELEATQHIGAAPYERTEDRTVERNGHRPRVLTTKAGDVELAIPKLRLGSFLPVILEPRRRDRCAQAELLQPFGLASRAQTGGVGGEAAERLSRIEALLREHLARLRRVNLGSQRVPRPRRSGIHTPDLYSSDAVVGRANERPRSTRCWRAALSSSTPRTAPTVVSRDAAPLCVPTAPLPLPRHARAMTSSVDPRAVDGDRLWRESPLVATQP